MSKIFYCSVCGQGLNEKDVYCWHCDKRITPSSSKNERSYYLRKAENEYNDWKQSKTILFEEEIQHNPQFDRSAYEARIQAKQKRESEKRLGSMIQHMTEEKNKNLPKCPTCSSVNIRKIGSIERGASFSLFGFASGKIGKSMICKDCGYKW